MATDPYRSYNFTLLIEGTSAGGFVSLSQLGADVSVIAYREAGSGPVVRNLPGLRTQCPVVLRYGVSQNRDLWDWFQATSTGTIHRRNVSIVQFDNNGNNEAFRWNLFDAWPSSFHVGELDTLKNEIAVERLTLVYDRLERD